MYRRGKTYRLKGLCTRIIIIIHKQIKEKWMKLQSQIIMKVLKASMAEGFSISLYILLIIKNIPTSKITYLPILPK